MATPNDVYLYIGMERRGCPDTEESHLILAFSETEKVLSEMLNKSQVIFSLYALKYGFGKIIFCKRDEKIGIVKEIADLKTRT